jgi:hypothetical protein
LYDRRKELKNSVGFMRYLKVATLCSRAYIEGGYPDNCTDE